MILNARNRDWTATTRRQWLKLAASGLGVAAGSGASAGWLQSLADDASTNPDRRRAVILLWMNGGPSQIDTFDPKPEHRNGGPVKSIETATPGVRISENLPKIAQWTQEMAIIRSMSTKEGDHGRATALMRTGYLPGGPIAYPPLGALVSKELSRDTDELPGFVSVGPFRAFSPASYSSGFLGPRFAPLIIGESQGFQAVNGTANADEALKVADLSHPRQLGIDRENARLELLGGLSEGFQAEHADSPAASQRTAYQRAVRLMRSEAAEAFNLTKEKDEIRDSYGRNPFGQGCLLARRLVERGVPFVEVTLNGVNGNALGWDTHNDNFKAVAALCGVLDPAWSTLMRDLKSRGLLESTLIVWMGEFGRTPVINPQQGRDHFPNAWTAVLAGGGIKGGQAIGDTGRDGLRVKENPASVGDLFATVCKGIGIDPMKQNMSDVGRPIRIVSPEAKPIKEALA